MSALYLYLNWHESLMKSGCDLWFFKRWSKMLKEGHDRSIITSNIFVSVSIIYYNRFRNGFTHPSPKVLNYITINLFEILIHNYDFSILKHFLHCLNPLSKGGFQSWSHLLILRFVLKLLIKLLIFLNKILKISSILNKFCWVI